MFAVLLIIFAGIFLVGSGAPFHNVLDLQDWIQWWDRDPRNGVVAVGGLLLGVLSAAIGLYQVFFDETIVIEAEKTRKEIDKVAEGQRTSLTMNAETLAILRRFEEVMQRGGNQMNPDTEVDRLTRELGTSRAVVLGMLKDILEQEIDPARLDEYVAKARTLFAEMRAELDRLQGLADELPDIAQDIAKARAALDRPDFADLAQAQDAIHQARLRYREAIHVHREQEDRNEGQLIEAEAAIALARFNFLEAAALFGEAANMLPQTATGERWHLKLKQASALQDGGDIDPERTTLERLIQLLAQEVQPLASRADSPLNWAKTQNCLGYALQSLGEREAGTERLKEAVAAHREALQEYTRERVPLEWAMTQNHLSTALQSLWEREAGAELLEEAVTACLEALQEYTRERVPLDWAMTQTHLGNALQSLGTLEAGTERLEEAVTAYREALKEYTREREPLYWAGTLNNLGVVLLSLGEREGETERLEEAVTAYREALKEYTRERVPLKWAMAQNNLGSALQSLGEREGGTERLEEAVTAHREVLKEYTRKRVPLKWAKTQNYLGVALQSLGEREAGTERLQEAVTAYREALKEYTRERVPLDWAMTNNNLAQAQQALAHKRGGSLRKG